MLSHNRRLCSVGWKICVDKDLIGQWDIGPVIHRSNAAGALFLVMGSEERENISRTELLAACMNVLRLRPRIVDEVKQQLTQLQTEMSVEELDALLTDPHCAAALMDATVAVDRIVDRSNVEEIVRVVKLALLDEEREKNAALLEESKSDAAKLLERVELDSESHIRELQRSLSEKTRVEERLKVELEGVRRARENALQTTVRQFSRYLRAGSVAARALLISVMLLVAAMTVILVPTHWDALFETIIGVVTLAVEAFAVLGFHIPEMIDKWLLSKVTIRFESAIAAASLEDVRKYFDVDFKKSEMKSVR